jgi:hypothetical protein
MPSGINYRPVQIIVTAVIKKTAPSIYPNPICQPKQASQATNGGV